MKKAELHMHTYFSSCSNLKPETILKKAKERKLDIIAITDHNQIDGALEVKALNKDKNLEVIIGEEVMTDKGELLIYYVKKQIKPGKFKEVVKEARKQNALISIAHPFSMRRGRKPNFTKEDIKQLDAIESFNGRIINKKANQKAENLAEELNLPKLSGSDAHLKSEIGKCPTYLEKDLRHSIKYKKTKPSGNTKGAFMKRNLSGLLKLIK